MVAAILGTQVNHHPTHYIDENIMKVDGPEGKRKRNSDPPLCLAQEVMWC